MEIRTLRYFLAVAREENMTRAAERLHLTQPTLSRQIRALEEELGVELFTRKNFSIRLSEEGRLLRARAEDLVRLADKIEGEFAAMEEPTGGELYFGLAESWQIRHLAREIRAFKERCPNLRYHVTSGDTEQVTEKLDRGVLDFAVLAEEPDRSKYFSLCLPEADVWGVLMRSDDALAEKTEIRAQDLVGLPMFCSEQAWRREIPRWCGEWMEKLRLEGSFRLAYNGSLFVREGLGYLLTYDRLIDTSPESGLTFRPLSPRLEAKMYLIWKRQSVFSPVAARFLDQLRASFGKAEPPLRGDDN